MTRLTRFTALLAVGALITAAPAAVPAKTNAPSATVSKSCDTGDGRDFGVTYVRWIRTRNVGCAKAKSVVRAFHACRKGARGRCGHRVKRFSCSESRVYGAIQFDSTVTCKRGGKRVRHGYTQNI